MTNIPTKDLKKINISVTIFLIGLLLVFLSVTITQRAGASVDYCDQSQLTICVNIYEVLPDGQIIAIASMPGYLNHFIFVEEQRTWFMFDANAIALTFEEIQDYLDMVELNLKINKARTTIYPDTQPAPYCMLDTDGSLNGLYSVNGQLFLNQDDPRCFGICDQGPCSPIFNGGQEIGINN